MRYSRQVRFLENNCQINSKENNFESKFQSLFKDKKIILVGCGGIGSVFAELLIRGGFLNLTLVDNDLIDETNLQRQIYFESDIGNFKSKSLKEILMKINSKSKIKVNCDVLTSDNIENLCKDSDLIIDATDNFETRKIINKYCEKNKKDWLYTGAVKSEIICCLFKGKLKLFSKVFSNNIKDESCCDVGVLSSTTYTAASFGYNQVLKYFIDMGNKSNENNKKTTLIKLNLWTNKIFEIKVK